MLVNDVKSKKTFLRKNFLKRRSEISDSNKKSKSIKILSKLIKLDKLKNADNICTYVSKTGEVDTILLIEHLISMNKSVYVPKSNIKSNVMTFYKINSLSELSLGAFSVLEPIPGLEEYKNHNKYDLCIVPALSFDKQGFRLGYGKGYYDRFLKNFDGVKIGLCFDEFITETLPKYNTDIAVDMIISEDETILCKGGK